MIFRIFEQKIIKDINESGMPIDAIYFIMKSIMAEIEQKYFEYCRKEDVKTIQQELETNQMDEEFNNENNEDISADNKEGAN